MKVTSVVKGIAPEYFTAFDALLVKNGAPPVTNQDSGTDADTDAGADAGTDTGMD
jgi:hypothetical protein